MWGSIHWELQQTRNPSPTKVEVPQIDDTTRECVTKEQVKEAIGGEIDTRFNKADSAQLCQGALFELLLLGYSANTDTALAIIEGTFTPPPKTTAATRIILEEIARIWEKMGMWKQAKERTASSFSGLHFVHYKVAAY